MTTLTFNAVFGVTPGYGHNNEGSADAVALVAAVWQAAMKAERIHSDILVTAIMTPATVVYPLEYGCPAGGEIAVQATGVLNMKYGTPPFEWKQAVIRVVEDVKRTLKQERVTLYFQHTESFHYLEGSG